MAKSKPIIEIDSYGIYEKWDATSKQLPQLVKFATQIEAAIDVEFGFIVNIKKAKGEKIYYCIYHPNIPDEKGFPLLPFDGEEYVGSNDWYFYLGDTIWSPIENKLGTWRMTIELRGKLVVEKSFKLTEAYLPTSV